MTTPNSSHATTVLVVETLTREYGLRLSKYIHQASVCICHMALRAIMHAHARRMAEKLNVKGQPCLAGEIRTSCHNSWQNGVGSANRCWSGKDYLDTYHRDEDQLEECRCVERAVRWVLRKVERVRHVIVPELECFERDSKRSVQSTSI